MTLSLVRPKDDAMVWSQARCETGLLAPFLGIGEWSRRVSLRALRRQAGWTLTSH